MRLVALSATALLIQTSCAGRSDTRYAKDPAAVGVRTYLQALRADDPRSAWKMLSEEARAGMAYQTFRALWRETEAEREQQARQLAEKLRSARDLGERAKVGYADGKSVSLRREGSEWQLEAELVSRTHAKSPRDAISLFSEALVEKDYERVMRILTSRRRQSIGDLVEAFVSSLQQHADDEIARIGEDRAELRWEAHDTHYKIVLRKEVDEWRVDDVHIRPKPEDEATRGGEEKAGDNE